MLVCVCCGVNDVVGAFISQCPSSCSQCDVTLTIEDGLGFVGVGIFRKRNEKMNGN
jgi:hypothetical protein